MGWNNKWCHREIFENVYAKFLDSVSKSNKIQHFKNNQPCKSRKEKLASQLNPFIDTDDEDINMVVPVFMAIDSNQMNDKDIEIC